MLCRDKFHPNKPFLPGDFLIQLKPHTDVLLLGTLTTLAQVSF